MAAAPELLNSGRVSVATLCYSVLCGLDPIVFKFWQLEKEYKLIRLNHSNEWSKLRDPGVF